MVQIRISADTKATLKDIGKMGDTYNDVITTLITVYKNVDKQTRISALSFNTDDLDREWIEAFAKSESSG